MSERAQDAHITVIGGARLRCAGNDVRLPMAAHRLLSFLALHEGGLKRQVIAEALWPMQGPERAMANVRSALWHARRIGKTTVVETASQRIALAEGVQVDLHQLTRSAHEIIDHPNSAAVPVGFGELVEPLSQEMLPDWSEDWITADRERWDQVRLHALETLAKRLLTAEQHLSALEVALTAVAIDPLRESAHRAVVEIHIAEGNSACAIRHYRHYRGLLQRELGVMPTHHMERLIHSLATSDRLN